MQNPTNRFCKNSVLFIIFTSLCTYNHHFSLLFAAIVGLSGLFIIQRKYLINYIILGILVFMLYIPHLGIFFDQLNSNGLTWLKKPNNDFLFEFIHYIFNYSTLTIVFSISLSVLGLKSIKQNKINSKFILLAFIWFLLPFLIGFYYSKHINAVLQFSVLIFSFPFLFFIFFGHLKAYTPKTNLILVTVILTANIFTLINNRQHYELFYKSIYQQILTDYTKVKKNNNKTIFIIDSHEKISQYYISKLNIDTNFIYCSKSLRDVTELKTYLEKESKNHTKLFFGCISAVTPNVVPLIQDYYPTIEIQNNYFGGTVYLFNKTENNEENLISDLDFDVETTTNWSSIDAKNLISINNNFSYKLDSNNEWGPTFSMHLAEIIENENNFIDLSLKVHTKESFEDGMLVGALESNGKEIYWGGTNFKKFNVSKKGKDGWIRIHHSIKLSDINQKHDHITLKVYVWNKNKENFIIDDFKIKLRKGNPIIYGTFERI